MAGIRGDRGELRIANQVAATLDRWNITRDDATGRRVLTAHCSTVNTFLAAQGPDVVVLQMGKVRWRWRDVALEIGGAEVRGTLVGSPEVR